MADEEGLILPDLRVATTMAIEMARDIVSSDAKTGSLRLGHHIEIENTDNGERTIVPFGSAVKIVG